MCTAKLVILPPNPAGPIPKLFIFSKVSFSIAAYFVAVGGVAALIARSVKKSEVIAYEDLGAEAVFRFYVKDFPAIVVIDSAGNNLYEIEPLKYMK